MMHAGNPENIGTNFPPLPDITNGSFNGTYTVTERCGNKCVVISIIRLSKSKRNTTRARHRPRPLPRHAGCLLSGCDDSLCARLISGSSGVFSAPGSNTGRRASFPDVNRSTSSFPRPHGSFVFWKDEFQFLNFDFKCSKYQVLIYFRADFLEISKQPYC